MIFRKRPTVVVHNSDFHADDVFAVASFELLLGRIRLVRTRDPKIIEAADYVADVGGIHDPAKRRFDHHQEGGAGKRENGIPYAAFGLVWKEYGAEICGSESVARVIDERLAQPLDASDNGVNIFDLKFPNVKPYVYEYAISTFRPTWKEDRNRMDEYFIAAVDAAKKLLLREIKKTKDREEASEIVKKAYEASPDKRLFVLEEDIPWHTISDSFPELLYVVLPEADRTQWRIYAVRKETHLFENRKNLPASWGGKKDAELAAVSGVPDAVFCHRGLFTGGARSKEGALKLAEIALNS